MLLVLVLSFTSAFGEEEELELARRLNIIREGGVGMNFESPEKACPAGVQLVVAPGEFGADALAAAIVAGDGSGKVTKGLFGILLPLGKEEGAEAATGELGVLDIVIVVEAAGRIGGVWIIGRDCSCWDCCCL